MKYINIPLPDKTKEMIEEYSKDSGIIIKKIVDTALVEFLKSKGYKK